MKSLTESILGSNRAGIDVSIRNWLEENEVIEDNAYEIKNHIIYPKKYITVQLFNNDSYDELPEYIQFGDGPYTLSIGDKQDSTKRSKEIKSFRGLPKNVGYFVIGFNKKDMKFPELNIRSARACVDGGSIIFNNKLNITNDDKYSTVGEMYQNFVFDEFINYKGESKSTFQGFQKVVTYQNSKMINDEISYMIGEDDINYIITYPSRNVELSKDTSELVDDLCSRLGFDESVNEISFFISPKICKEDVRSYLYKDKGGLWHFSRMVPIQH